MRSYPTRSVTAFSFSRTIENNANSGKSAPISPAMVALILVAIVLIIPVALFLRWNKRRKKTVEGHQQIKRLDSRRVSTILGTKPLTLTIENKENWIGRPNVFDAEWVSTPTNSVNFGY